MTSYDDRSAADLARSADCEVPGCGLAAVFDTGRCLPDQLPVPRVKDCAHEWARTQSFVDGPAFETCRRCPARRALCPLDGEPLGSAAVRVNDTGEYVHADGTRHLDHTAVPTVVQRIPLTSVAEHVQIEAGLFEAVTPTDVAQAAGHAITTAADLGASGRSEGYARGWLARALGRIFA
jgi:hypothetical protein